jgi:sugar transferase (PEP-CTERM system associated)
VIRVFRHYVYRYTLRQIVFDFSFIFFALVGIFGTHVKNPELLLSLTASHGLSLAAGTFLINSVSGIYQPAHRSLHQSIARAALAAFLALPLAYGLFAVMPPQVEAQVGILVYAAMGVVLVAIAHRVYATHAKARATASSRILILGCGPTAVLVADTLKAADPHAQIIGYFPSPNERDSTVLASQVFSSVNSLASVAEQERVDEIVVALTERRGGSMSLRDLLECKTKGICVCDLSTHFEKTLGQIRLDYVNAGWLIFGDGFDQGLWRTAVKRLFDIACAITLLFASVPILIGTAILIAIESRGPILFRQQRIGLNGKPFVVFKFRSMCADAEKDGQPRWAVARDDRITRVGRVMRMLRIDELPQLVNVLKGEMSIVGPRPERPFFVDQLTREIPYYAVRHSVKPGVTGWAQVRYHYGSTVEDSEQKLQYDLYYVKNHTLFLDLLILFETVSVVLMGKGAR